MNDISLILIDPQKGFCSSHGSLALQYGEYELKEIQKAILNIVGSIAESGRCHLVKSEYSPAQFTDGNKSHNLANLCVPYANEDCEIIDDLKEIDFHSVSVKNQQSALSSKSFMAAIDQDLLEGIKTYIIFGFLLDHCVKKTAVDLKEYITKSGANVVVCQDLSATRLEKYKNGVVDKTLSELVSLGVRIEYWENIADSLRSSRI